MTQRQEIIERLNGLEIEGGSHAMLSAICKAVLPHGDAWTLRRCADLRDRLVRLLGETEQPKEQGEVEREIASAKSAAYDQGYDHGYQEGKRDGDDEWYEEHESYLEEHGWYQALDADKQTIRFNDDVEWELLGSGETERGYVVGIKIDLIAGRQSCRVKVVRDSDFQTIELMAKNLYHVKPAEPEPTVEDVLYDSLKHFGAVEERTPEVDSWVCEQAAKLREMLAGDAE